MRVCFTYGGLGGAGAVLVKHQPIWYWALLWVTVEQQLPEMNDLIIFTNEIQGDIQVQNSITRDHDFDLQFNCSYSRKKLIGLSFITGEIFVQDEGIGTINEHMHLCHYL